MEDWNWIHQINNRIAIPDYGDDCSLQTALPSPHPPPVRRIWKRSIDSTKTQQTNRRKCRESCRNLVTCQDNLYPVTELRRCRQDGIPVVQVDYLPNGTSRRFSCGISI